jgi:plasmid stabilization system protein ParE
MTLAVEYSPLFEADLWLQLAWYAEQGGFELAEQFTAAVELTVQGLRRTPGLGRTAFPNDPELLHLQSFLVQAPFGWHRIFYRTTASTLFLERLMHGARDLPHRLLEPPGPG